jgi:hypothetical protein
MNASAVQQIIPAEHVWRMPVRPERCDRSPLSDRERAALTVLVEGDERLNSPARRKPETILVRLTRPLHEVYALRRTDASVRPTATRVMFTQSIVAARPSGSGRLRSGATWWVYSRVVRDR